MLQGLPNEVKPVVEAAARRAISGVLHAHTPVRRRLTFAACKYNAHMFLDGGAHPCIRACSWM
jgi:hypothetical protein